MIAGWLPPPTPDDSEISLPPFDLDVNLDGFLIAMPPSMKCEISGVHAILNHHLKGGYGEIRSIAISQDEHILISVIYTSSWAFFNGAPVPNSSVLEFLESNRDACSVVKDLSEVQVGLVIKSVDVGFCEKAAVPVVDFVRQYQTLR
jgi:hypothetical protein